MFMMALLVWGLAIPSFLCQKVLNVLMGLQAYSQLFVTRVIHDLLDEVRFELPPAWQYLLIASESLTSLFALH